jgi:hypothetical protein
MRLPGIVKPTVLRSMVAIAVLAVYLASYRALVLPVIYLGSEGHPDQVEASYRYAPRLCTVLFAPANRLDRALRPRYWARPACVW